MGAGEHRPGHYEHEGGQPREAMIAARDDACRHGGHLGGRRCLCTRRSGCGVMLAAAVRALLVARLCGGCAGPWRVARSGPLHRWRDVAASRGRVRRTWVVRALGALGGARRRLLLRRVGHLRAGARGHLLDVGVSAGRNLCLRQRGGHRHGDDCGGGDGQPSAGLDAAGVHGQRPWPRSRQGIVMRMILRSSHRDQFSM